MAIHYSIPSMLQESLIEMVLVADYCIKFRKDSKIWSSKGCFGYPAAILLFSIVDSIGSYVLKRKNSFKILKDPGYYNLNINDIDIVVINKKYRNLLNHNAVIANSCLLDIGTKKSPVFERRNGSYCINLIPFVRITKKVVLKFLKKADKIVMNSKEIKNILNI